MGIVKLFESSDPRLAERMEFEIQEYIFGLLRGKNPEEDERIRRIFRFNQFKFADHRLKYLETNFQYFTTESGRIQTLILGEIGYNCKNVMISPILMFDVNDNSSVDEALESEWMTGNSAIEHLYRKTLS